MIIFENIRYYQKRYNPEEWLYWGNDWRQSLMDTDSCPNQIRISDPRVWAWKIVQMCHFNSVSRCLFIIVFGSFGLCFFGWCFTTKVSFAMKPWKLWGAISNGSKRVAMKRRRMEIGQSLGHILSASRFSARRNDDIYENAQLAI